MKMKMAPTLIALAIAAMGTTTAQAADDWYTGMGAGWAYGHDLDTFGQDADKDATALSLFGGYNFTENFAAELGFSMPARLASMASTSRPRVPPCPVSHACP